MRGPAAPRGGAWLRYKEDRRTLGFCALYFGFVAAAWQVEWAQRSYALSGLTFLVLTFTGFQGCVTVHNCAHCPPFQSAALNSIWCARRRPRAPRRARGRGRGRLRRGRAPPRPRGLRRLSLARAASARAGL